MAASAGSPSGRSSSSRFRPLCSSRSGSARHGAVGDYQEPRPLRPRGGGLLASVVLADQRHARRAMRSIDDGPHWASWQPLGIESHRGRRGLLLLITALVVARSSCNTARDPHDVSVSAGVAGVAIVIVVAWMWPWHPRPLPVPEWASRETSLRLVAESSKGEFASEHWSPWGRSEGSRIGRARLRLSGIEEGWLATVRLADGSVHFDDGVTLAPLETDSRSPFHSSRSMIPPLWSSCVTSWPLSGCRQGRSAMSSRWAVPAIVLRPADFRSIRRRAAPTAGASWWIWTGSRLRPRSRSSLAPNYRDRRAPNPDRPGHPADGVRHYPGAPVHGGNDVRFRPASPAVVLPSKPRRCRGRYGVGRRDDAYVNGNGASIHARPRRVVGRVRHRLQRDGRVHLRSPATIQRKTPSLSAPTGCRTRSWSLYVPSSGVR